MFTLIVTLLANAHAYAYALVSLYVYSTHPYQIIC